MKSLLTLLIAFISLQLLAQAPPQGINYQAVAYDFDNYPIPGVDASMLALADQDITVRFSLIQNNPSGNVVYQEYHQTTTDMTGLFNLIIGQGTLDNSPGNFEDINWAASTYFLKVEIDNKGGFDYMTMSTQQLWSVPYALYAEKAGNGIDNIIDNGDGTLTINFLDSSSYTTNTLSGAQGPQGPAGPQGNQGPAGNGIVNVTTQNDSLIVTLSDGTILNGGPVFIDNDSCYWKLNDTTKRSIFYDRQVSIRESDTTKGSLFIYLVANTDSTHSTVFFMDANDAWTSSNYPSGPMIVINRNDGNTLVQDRSQIIRTSTGLRFCLQEIPFGLSNEPVTRMFLHENGNVGVATTAPTQRLSVNGSAGKTGGGSWATFSDRRVKENILPFNDGMDILKQLNPVQYNFTEKSSYEDTNKTYIGFIAQEVEKVAPYMVERIDDREGISGLEDLRQFDESALSKIMLNAIKQQQAEIENQQSKIDAQQKLILQLIDRIDKLEKSDK